MNLTSDAFGEDASIPREHTCQGTDRSPPLRWRGAPAGTRSFAIVCDDPDAPRGTFGHWAIYDIPAEVAHLETGHSRPDRPSPYPEGANDLGWASWGGPCPPVGHGPHRYRFRVLALGVDRLGLGPGTKIAEVERAARAHALGEAHLTGTYER